MSYRVRDSENGFTSLIIALVVAVAIAAVGLLVYSNHSDNKTASQQPAVTKTAFSGLPKVYKNDSDHFTIHYPSDWKLETSTDPMNLPQAKLTSPNGTVLNINSEFGGRGGDCQPAATDKPFQPGNVCSTKEYLSAEKLTEVNNLYFAKYGKATLGVDDVSYHKMPVYLTTSHFADSDGKSSYIIGLDESLPDEDAPFETNVAHMGLNYDQEFFTVTDSKHKSYMEVEAYSLSSSPDFFDSADGKTVKAIFKSIRFDLP